MGPLLRQSTAYTFRMGPFVSDEDGFTPQTGLTPVYRVSKAGGDIGARSGAVAPAHDELGWYSCALDATDTNTLGHLQVMSHPAGALPVWSPMFTVVPQDVYDSLVAGTRDLPVAVVSFGGGVESTTIHVTAGGLDIDGVRVWITTTSDSAGPKVAEGYTDSNGNVTFLLDPGTYWRHAQKAGYSWTAATFTVP